MALIKFDLARVADAEHGLTVKLNQQTSAVSALTNFSASQRPGELRYGSMGGISPLLRTGVPRVALAMLSATGVLAALIAMSASDKKVAFSCALAAAVNFVACAHYHYIIRVRAWDLSTGLLQLASDRNLDGESVGENDNAKWFAQESAVDALRHADWAVTLPILTLDLYRLSEHATGGAKSWLDQYTAAALISLMVFLGAVYRFYANELRSKSKNGSIDTMHMIAGVVAFGGSCVVFGIVISGILNPIESELCGPGLCGPGPCGPDAKCPITEPELQYDRDAVRTLTYVWIGYPLVSLLSRAKLRPDHHYSFLKDICYALLDVVAKAGLALYVCFRSTWF